jgi:hypothetical protein
MFIGSPRLSGATPMIAHYSICKSSFSIANGGVYFINQHAEQPNHPTFS